MWLTLAPVKVNSDQVRPPRQLSAARSGSCADTERESVQSVTVEAASRQVLLWFDSFWSVRLSQMSSFITADLPDTTHIVEMCLATVWRKVPVQKQILSEWHFVANSLALQNYKWPGLPEGTFLYPSDFSSTSGKDLPAFVKGKKNSGGDWVKPLHVDKTDWLWQDKTVPWLRCFS